jgi:hypothetical protein
MLVPGRSTDKTNAIRELYTCLRVGTSILPWWHSSAERMLPPDHVTTGISDLRAGE